MKSDRNRLQSSRKLAAVWFGASLLWLTALVAAPYAVVRGSQIEGGLYFASLTYLGSGLVCHQKPERSFYLWTVKLPVCARCAGLYAAAPAGAALALLVAGPGRGARTVARWRLLLAIAAAPTLTTLAVEWGGLAALSNLSRSLAAVPLGLVVAWLVGTTARGFLR